MNRKRRGGFSILAAVLAVMLALFLGLLFWLLHGNEEPGADFAGGCRD